MKGKVLGSTLIIAGTAIGAGMLAIPIVTAGLGFFFSSFLLVVCWAVMVLTAFLVLHVNMAFKEHSNFTTMARHTIGPVGKMVTWISYSLLLYSLTAAYIAGGSSLLNDTLGSVFHLEVSPPLSAFLFTGILGLFVYIGTQFVDYASRLLMILKVGSFLFMVVLLFPHVHLDRISIENNWKTGGMVALPVILTSFGFHTVIPNLRDYLSSNVKKLKRVILIGSLIPLLVYVLWEGVVLGTISNLSHNMGVSDMVQRLSRDLDSPFLGWIVRFFSDVALTTSFLGVSMGLFHFIRDAFRLNQQKMGEKPLAAFITFFPPLCFAWFYPQGFVMALNYASIFVVILLIFVPLWMSWQLKKKNKTSQYPFDLHWSGYLLVIAFGLFVIGSYFLSK